MRKGILAVVLALVSSTAFGGAVTFLATGPDPASIQPTVDVFRTALGALNANVAGSFPSGRREINWDGVPDSLSAPNNLPANFFNVNSPRGVVFSTAGTGFQVSADSANPTFTPVEFSNINPTYSASFTTFSAERLFTALGSTVTDVNFFIPGSTTPATTNGFGVIFTDVDIAATTSIQLFDAGGISLGTFSALTANNGLSFLGVLFDAGERVGRVRITSGNSVLSAVNPAAGEDVVVMDDFLYGEPHGQVALTKGFSPTTIVQGGTTVLTFTVTNSAGSPALSNIGFTDTLPSGLVVGNPAGVSGTCTNAAAATTATAGTNTITVSSLQVPAGASLCTVTVNVTNAPAQTNASCKGFPAAFTNTATNISAIANVGNAVQPNCLVVNAPPTSSTPTSTPTNTPTNTPTSTPTNTPTSTPTNTPTLVPPTSTPTFVGGGGPAPGSIPTLSPAMLALLALGLAATALFLVRRS